MRPPVERLIRFALIADAVVALFVIVLAYFF
jgi:hypothetical protein